MSRILPFRQEIEVGADSPRVVDLEGDDAEAVFNALASDTARDIYRTLYQDPATASEVAEAVDTSVQNVRYHLDNLQSAGLIEQVDIWYSSRGNEMAVYAPADGALIVSGQDSGVSELRSAVESVIGGLAVLAAASVAFQFFLMDFFTETATHSTEPGTGGDVGFTTLSDPAPIVTDPTGSDSAIETVVGEVMTLPPGALLFIGGVIALVSVVSIQYVR